MGQPLPNNRYPLFLSLSAARARLSTLTSNSQDIRSAMEAYLMCQLANFFVPAIFFELHGLIFLCQLIILLCQLIFFWTGPHLFNSRFYLALFFLIPGYDPFPYDRHKVIYLRIMQVDSARAE